MLGFVIFNDPPLQQTAAKWKEYGSLLRGLPKAGSFGSGLFVCVFEVTTMASSKKKKQENNRGLSHETNVSSPLEGRGLR